MEQLESLLPTENESTQLENIEMMKIMKVIILMITMRMKMTNLKLLVI